MKTLPPIPVCCSASPSERCFNLVLEITSVLMSKGTLGTCLRKEGFQQWNRVAVVPQTLVWCMGLLLAKYEVRLSHYLENIWQLQFSRGNCIGLKVFIFWDYCPSWTTLSRNSCVLCLDSWFLKTGTFKRNNLPCSLWLMLMLLNTEEGWQKECGSFIETQVVQQKENNFLHLDPLPLKLSEK